MLIVLDAFESELLVKFGFQGSTVLVKNNVEAGCGEVTAEFRLFPQLAYVS